MGMAVCGCGIVLKGYMTVYVRVKEWLCGVGYADVGYVIVYLVYVLVLGVSEEMGMAVCGCGIVLEGYITVFEVSPKYALVICRTSLGIMLIREQVKVINPLAASDVVSADKVVADAMEGHDDNVDDDALEKAQGGATNALL
ncbi:hypothetical protein Droror1_Dr00015969 [Drosera rotundifolia]